MALVWLLYTMWQRLQTKQPAVFADGAGLLLFPVLTGNTYDLVLQQLLRAFDLGPVDEDDFPFCVMVAF